MHIHPGNEQPSSFHQTEDPTFFFAVSLHKNGTKSPQQTNEKSSCSLVVGKPKEECMCTFCCSELKILVLLKQQTFHPRAYRRDIEAKEENANHQRIVFEDNIAGNFIKCYLNLRLCASYEHGCRIVGDDNMMSVFYNLTTNLFSYFITK